MKVGELWGEPSRRTAG